MGGARRTLDRRRGGRKDMCSVLRSISFPAGAVPRLLRARVVLVVWRRSAVGRGVGGRPSGVVSLGKGGSGGSGITRLFREFVNLLLPRITPRTIGGDLRQAAGLMGRSRVRGAIFLAAAAVFAAGEATQSPACDEAYKKTVCPEVCTSTLAEQCAAGV